MKHFFQAQPQSSGRWQTPLASTTMGGPTGGWEKPWHQQQYMFVLPLEQVGWRSNWKGTDPMQLGHWRGTPGQGHTQEKQPRGNRASLKKAET